MKRVIDISHHNTIKSWDALAEKIDGVMIRIGHGKKGIDHKFEEHITEAKRVGIPYGFYLYSDIMSESELTDIFYEVERLKDVWLNYRSYFYRTPIAYDEEGSAGLPQLEQMVGELMRVKPLVDSVMWYTGMARFNMSYPAKIRDELKENFELWIARYNTKAPDVFSTMWQRSSSWKIESISDGYIDMNYISDAAFNFLFGLRKEFE